MSEIASCLVLRSKASERREAMTAFSTLRIHNNHMPYLVDRARRGHRPGRWSLLRIARSNRLRTWILGAMSCLPHKRRTRRCQLYPCISQIHIACMGPRRVQYNPRCTGSLMHYHLLQARWSRLGMMCRSLPPASSKISCTRLLQQNFKVHLSTIYSHTAPELVAPSSVRYMPLGQDVQASSPKPILYLPGKQAAQAPLSLSSVWPLTQMQSVDAMVPEKDVDEFEGQF